MMPRTDKPERDTKLPGAERGPEARYGLGGIRSVLASKDFVSKDFELTNLSHVAAPSGECAEHHYRE